MSDFYFLLLEGHKWPMDTFLLLYPPQTKFGGTGYIGITLSVRPSLSCWRNFPWTTWRILMKLHAKEGHDMRCAWNNIIVVGQPEMEIIQLTFLIDFLISTTPPKPPYRFWWNFTQKKDNLHEDVHEEI